MEKSKYKKFKNNHQKTYKTNSIDLNFKGFLCSCDREKDAIKESYNLLNKYADILWPPSSSEVESLIPENCEDPLKFELEQLKKEKKRFQLINTGARNFFFIKTTLENPTQLAHSILKEIHEKNQPESRFLLRIVPIEITCKAFLRDIEKSFEPLCEKYFTNEAKTFSIVFNHRNNNSTVTRDEVIKSIAETITKMGKEKELEHKVDLKNAQVTIVVEIVRSFAFLGVVPEFCRFKKYNLIVANQSSTESENNL